MTNEAKKTISRKKAEKLLYEFAEWLNNWEWNDENDIQRIKIDKRIKEFLEETYGMSKTQQIISLFNKGYNTREIAKIVGKTRDSVNGTLNRHGIIIPKERRLKTGFMPTDNTKYRVDYIKNAMNDGRSQAQIARELRITRQAVNRIYKKYIGK